MPYRYNSREDIGISKFDMPKQVKTLRKRDVIGIYSSPTFNRITDQMMEDIDFQLYTWKQGDKLCNLAHEFYGDTRYWWVIALFNNTPTEHHISLGDQLFIPEDYLLVASILGVE